MLFLFNSIRHLSHLSELKSKYKDKKEIFKDSFVNRLILVCAIYIYSYTQ